MKTILGLATYPITLPRHGGQRRIAAFAEYYRSIGVNYRAACVYDPGSYGPGLVGPDDLPLSYIDGTRGDTPFIGDLQAGEFAASSPAAYRHFRALVERLQPDAVQLEQPFMWPLVERLKRDGVLNGVRVIYSSQNWEAPLKADILDRAGLPEAVSASIASEIEALEGEVCANSAAIIAVSAGDAAIYAQLVGPEKPVTLIPNGVSRRPAIDEQARQRVSVFGARAPLVFVGSAYPPNIDGFLNLVARDGLFFVPPEKVFAIAGGAAGGIVGSEAYGRFRAANAERAVAFPDISDMDLFALQAISRGTILPIQFGGGSNLKTAEALVQGKWVVATPQALRSFERFRDAPGVLVADDARQFRLAMRHALNEPHPVLTEAEVAQRDALYWDGAFKNSAFHPFDEAGPQANLA